MGISVDHEARKRDIIAKAVRLFAKEGYGGVTYQKIADACGVARTTLYRYYPSKGIIFNTAIWQITEELTDRYVFILSSRTSVSQRLERLLCAVLAMIYRQRTMLTVIFDYLIFGIGIPGYPTLVCLILLFGGLQLLAIGVVGDYLARSYIESKQRPIYIVRDRLERDF